MAAGVYRGDYILRPLKWYRSLSIGKIRRQEGCFLIEGEKAVDQVVASHPNSITEIVMSETFPVPLFADAFPCRILTPQQFEQVCSSVNPQGIAAVLKIPDDAYSSTLPAQPGKHIVLLDDVQDPGNMGTIIRTAAAFAFSGVLISGNSADPFSSKVVQASAGALFVPWIRRYAEVIDSVKILQAQGYRLYCADLAGDGVLAPSADEKVIIALGNEGGGICSLLLACADVRYSIPMDRTAVESLNVAVAGAISLFTVYQHAGQ